MDSNGHRAAKQIKSLPVSVLRYSLDDFLPFVQKKPREGGRPAKTRAAKAGGGGS